MTTETDYFGPDGKLSDCIDNFEHREQQAQMADAVRKSFDDRVPLIVEAATGTGKTFAYLIPALASGKRVVVSTQTKALQEQLFEKDIPKVQKVWPKEIRSVLLKGRKNYLCLLRFDRMKAAPNFRNRADAKHWSTIRSWATKTETGDRNEIKGLPDEFSTWNDLSVGSEACLGSNCPFHEQCFVTRARKNASTADVVVVNHHLFFADLALRDLGHGEILPNYDAVIFDEAHHLESVATSYFGMQISNFRYRELTGDIARAMDSENSDDHDLKIAISDVDRYAKTFFSNLSFGLYDGRYMLGETIEKNLTKDLTEPRKKLFEAIDTLDSAIRKCSKLGEIGDKLAGRARTLRFETDFVLNMSDDKFVYFLELRDRGVFLDASPIDIAEKLRAKLLDTHDRMVFTSATLATGGSLDYFEERLGITMTEDDVRPEYLIDRLILPPVFDYENQCMVYVPSRISPPNSPKFPSDVSTIVEYLLGITGGYAFVLFTSYANMNAVYDLVAPKLDVTVLKQGEKPKGELLDIFREDESSVLFATASFWEGVDVEGDALRLVIIDKLPFGNPSDPLFAARSQLAESRGDNPFRTLTMPAAALTLKQGFGRLIRSQNDKGVVAILDSRIIHKFYGTYFLESLPPAKRASRAAEVRDWWKLNIDESE